MNELWTDIKGYEGHYHISTFGRVKSLERLAFNGFKNHVLRERILKPSLNRKTGYLSVILSKDGFTVCKRINRLVANEFIPNPKSLLEVNHKDGNKLNNYSENLEWVSRQENATHAQVNGLIQKGEECSFSKLTENQIKEIRRLSGKLTQKKIGEKFGITQTTVFNIIHRNIWKHI